jgi:thymidylate synthase (FAD)
MEIKVLDKGFVRLDGYMADDLSVVNAAKVSFNKRSNSMGDAESGLINFLMKNRHGTPFEHNAFRFHAKVPIFVFRDWVRHRIASYNEWSGRYSELKNEFYIPEPENVRKQIGKPGNYKFEPIDRETALKYIKGLEKACKRSYKYYQFFLKIGVAKEQARMALNVNIYTEFYWTINARSLMNYLSLRNDSAAQWEIQEYAKVIESIFAEKMPITHETFIKNGRVAP